jgi:ribonuclease HII
VAPPTTTRATRPAPRVAAPSLREERKLLRAGHRWLAAIDEVGRGALAGPVSVGVVVIDLETRSAPAGVRDSKLLTPAHRRALVPRLRRWAPLHAVGHASPQEIDRIGIIAALRLAACRALDEIPVRPDCALLDGNHNWLHRGGRVLEEAPPALFEVAAPDTPPDPVWVPPVVVTRIKADLRCAAVAAASVLAKVERDARMVTLAREHPEYGWDDNKGYSAPEHLAALRSHGASPLHRRSWALPGLDGPSDEAGPGPGQAVLDLTAWASRDDVIDLDAR